MPTLTLLLYFEQQLQLESIKLRLVTNVTCPHYVICESLQHGKFSMGISRCTILRVYSSFSMKHHYLANESYAQILKQSTARPFSSQLISIKTQWDGKQRFVKGQPSRTKKKQPNITSFRRTTLDKVKP